MKSDAICPMLSFLVHRRGYLTDRLNVSLGWFCRLSIVSALTSVSMGIALAVCAKASLLFGMELGVLCAVPLLFLLWLPFLLTAFIVEITGADRACVIIPASLVPNPYFSVEDVYLPFPFIPPRVGLA